MALLRLLVLVCACACAMGFSPAAMPRSSTSQRSAAISMKTAATKPQRVNARNREYNKQYKSEMRTRIKRVRTALLNTGSDSAQSGGSGRLDSPLPLPLRACTSQS